MEERGREMYHDQRKEQERQVEMRVPQQHTCRLSLRRRIDPNTELEGSGWGIQLSRLRWKTHEEPAPITPPLKGADADPPPILTLTLWRD